MVGARPVRGHTLPHPRILMEGGRPLSRPHTPPIHALPRSLAAILHSLCGIVGTIGHGGQSFSGTLTLLFSVSTLKPTAGPSCGSFL